MWWVLLWLWLDILFSKRFPVQASFVIPVFRILTLTLFVSCLVFYKVFFVHFLLNDHQTCVDKRLFEELGLKHLYKMLYSHVFSVLIDVRESNWRNNHNLLLLQKLLLFFELVGNDSV